jgi:hypothetical protein
MSYRSSIYKTSCLTWSSCNKLAMEVVPFIPTEVVKKAKSLTIEFFFSLPCKGAALPKSTTLIGWQHLGIQDLLVRVVCCGIVMGIGLVGFPTNWALPTL